MRVRLNVYILPLSLALISCYVLYIGFQHQPKLNVVCIHRSHPSLLRFPFARSSFLHHPVLVVDRIQAKFQS